jgi:hypothetical protein
MGNENDHLLGQLPQCIPGTVVSHSMLGTLSVLRLPAVAGSKLDIRLSVFL